jgi:hypothetical protein
MDANACALQEVVNALSAQPNYERNGIGVHTYIRRCSRNKATTRPFIVKLTD